MNAQGLGCAAVVGIVIDKERLVGLETGVGEHMAEDGGVGLGQMQPVGEIDALKHVVGTPGAIVEEMVGAESPVHIVGIAEQEHAVVAAQAEQPLLLLVGDGGEQRIPGSDNRRVGG